MKYKSFNGAPEASLEIYHTFKYTLIMNRVKCSKFNSSVFLSSNCDRNKNIFKQ
jgi:hypothetical protein